MKLVDTKIDGPAILTYTGRYVNPMAMHPRDVDIQDIAHALSNQCRYSGHVHTFYSVAEHSVRVAEFLEDAGVHRKRVLAGLLHDAAEAYLVDLPRPLKQDAEIGYGYRKAEERAMVAIELGLGAKITGSTYVHDADLVLLATERRDLMPPNGDWKILTNVSPIRETIAPWTPAEAKRRFLLAYELVTRGSPITQPPVAPESICAEADRIVSTERRADYGHPLDNFQQTADLWNALFSDRLTAPLEAEDVGRAMIAVKLSRDTSAPKRDNRVDIAGYAKTLDLIADERETRAALDHPLWVTRPQLVTQPVRQW